MFGSEGWTVRKTEAGWMADKGGMLGHHDRGDAQFLAKIG